MLVPMVQLTTQRLYKSIQKARYCYYRL